ncbi:VIT domain-containing protein [Kaarinaea lacus]
MPEQSNPTAQPSLSSSPVFRQTVRSAIKAAPGFYIIIFGVILPVITLGFELYFHACGSSLFDPIPTVWHVLLIAVVPVANLWVWISLYNKRYQRWLIPFNGLAMGVAAFYAILFIPITPIAVLVSWLGFGLLPLSPLLSFIACIIGHVKLKKLILQQDEAKVERLRWGIAMSISLLVLLQLPLTVTNVALKMASAEEKSTRQSGITLLRRVGDQETMLRACYIRSGRPMDMVSFLLGLWKTNVSTDEAREIYYRVTGESFNSVAPPELLEGRRGVWFGAAWDAQQGSDSVGGKVKDLWLSSSIVDGSVAVESNVAYLEWTFVFKNDSLRNVEARAHLELPPDAVVSRVTLWVNGEEREAAFAGRSETREAYQRVVRRQRDPILVTTAGKDTVMMQMFPVPVNGEMKARLGITVPLHILEKDRSVLKLPYIKESNFLLADGVNHEVWIESKSPIEFSRTNLSTQPLNGVYRLRDNVTDEKLADPDTHILINNQSPWSPVFAFDTKAGQTKVVHQSVEKIYHEFERLVLVIDASASMKAIKSDLVTALKSIAVETELFAVVAGDDIQEYAVGNFNSPQYKSFIEALEGLAFKGGRDNVPALWRAWELATQRSNSAILWVHGPQPVVLQSAEGLRHGWERDVNGPLLTDFQVVKGRNHIIEKLDGISAINKVLRAGSFIDDFKRWSAIVDSKKPLYRYVRTTENAIKKLSGDQQDASHIVRLWANDKIQRLLAEKNQEARLKAIRLAAKYQLVTPVSGAVVLETQEQYKQAGLQPVEPGTVPTIPEPEFWAMLVIALFMIIAVMRRESWLRSHTL